MFLRKSSPVSPCHAFVNPKPYFYQCVSQQTWMYREDQSHSECFYSYYSRSPIFQLLQDQTGAKPLSILKHFKWIFFFFFFWTIWSTIWVMTMTDAMDPQMQSGTITLITVYPATFYIYRVWCSSSWYSNYEFHGITNYCMCIYYTDEERLVRNSACHAAMAYQTQCRLAGVTISFPQMCRRRVRGENFSCRKDHEYFIG